MGLQGRGSLALVFLTALFCASGAPHDQWTSRRVIYQVLTDRFARDPDATGDSCNSGHCQWGNYCGGTYEGILSKLDYIKGMNFNALWISPIPGQIPCGYHGYWTKDWNRYNTFFGDANGDELKRMTDQLHSEDIWVMLDIVANHNGPGVYNASPPSSWPFDRREHYHPPCQIDWNRQESIERCWLVNLPDLNTEDWFVQDFLIDWVAQQVDRFGFDGLRIDTTPYVPKWFWQRMVQRLPGTYTLGEVLIGGRALSYFAKYQYDEHHGGRVLDAVLNYPLYWALINSFQRRQSLWGVANILRQIQDTFRDVASLGVFIDCHDQDRFLLHEPSHTLYQNALTFVLTTTGVPIIYYGTEQGMTQSPDASYGDDNRRREALWKVGYNTEHPLYHFLARLNLLRTLGVFDGAQRELWVLNEIYFFARGERVLVVTANIGDGRSFDINLPPDNIPQAFRGQRYFCDLLKLRGSAVLAFFSNINNTPISTPPAAFLQTSSAVREATWEGQALTTNETKRDHMLHTIAVAKGESMSSQSESEGSAFEPFLPPSQKPRNHTREELVRAETPLAPFVNPLACVGPDELKLPCGPSPGEASQPSADACMAAGCCFGLPLNDWDFVPYCFHPMVPSLINAPPHPRPRRNPTQRGHRVGQGACREMPHGVSGGFHVHIKGGMPQIWMAMPREAAVSK